MNKLNVVGLGIAFGLVWAIGVLITGWTAMFGWGDAFVTMVGSFYIGYKASFIGAIIGAIWAFVDLFIGGVLVAFFYNHFSSTKKRRK